MRLNPDCIRDILMAVETHSDFCTQAEYKVEDPFPELSAHSHEEILYHIRQCEESGLIHDVHTIMMVVNTQISLISPLLVMSSFQTCVTTLFGVKLLKKVKVLHWLSLWS